MTRVGRWRSRPGQETSARSTAGLAAWRLRAAAEALFSSTLFWLLFTTALILITFGPTLDDWFVSDDFMFLRAARYVGPLTYVKEAFDFTGYDRHEVFVDFLRDDAVALPFLAYRPLYFISLQAMHLVFGDDPAGYHVVSVAIHGANTLLVWLIAHRLLKSRLGAHIAAVIFALHPAYVAAVAWISDVATLLATFAALLAVLCFLKAMDRDPARRWWVVASLVCYGASMYFHFGTVSWVAVFLVFGVFRRARDRRALRPKRWAVLAPYVAVGAGTYALQAWIAAGTPVQEGSYFIGRHMMTHFKNLGAAALYPVTSEAATAHFAAFVALLAMMASLPALALLRRRPRAFPAVELLVVGWFLAAVVPFLTSNLDYFFRVGVLDRKLYSAGPALAMMLVMYGGHLLSMVPGRLRPQATSLAALLLALALAGSMTLAADHRDDVSAQGAESERFVTALRKEYPSLPVGSSLYVLGAPPVLTAFGDTYLLAAVQAFYGRVDAYAVGEIHAEAVRQRGDSNDYFFRFGPAPAKVSPVQRRHQLAD